MLYLSQVLGRPIRDLEGERVATVKDVIVRLGADDHPPVTGLVARFGRREFFLSRWRITDLNESGARLNSDKLNLRPFVRRDGEAVGVEVAAPHHGQRDDGTHDEHRPLGTSCNELEAAQEAEQQGRAGQRRPRQGRSRRAPRQEG